MLDNNVAIAAVTLIDYLAFLYIDLCHPIFSAGYKQGVPFRTMFSSSNIMSCNFSHLPLRSHHSISLHRTPIISQPVNLPPCIQPYRYKASLNSLRGKHFLPIRRSFLNSEESKGPKLKMKASPKSELADKGDGGKGKDWATSILLFCLWSALLYYVFNLAPNQTPVI